MIVMKFTSDDDFSKAFSGDGIATLTGDSGKEVMFYFKSADYKRVGDKHEVCYHGVRNVTVFDAIRAFFVELFRR